MKEKVLNLFKDCNVKNEVLAGLTVALALVPEAIGFSLIAGVKPLHGLYAAVILGIISSFVGGRPGMISGATGPLAVMVVGIVALNKIEGVPLVENPYYLFAAITLMGLFQITAGLLKLGKFVRMIPYPVIIGFLNGLAIVIFKAQFPQFMTGPENARVWMTGSKLHWMIGLVLITMLIMKYFPKLTKAVPAGLIAILVPSLLVYFLKLDVSTVGDMSSIAGGFPKIVIGDVLNNIPFTFESLRIIIPAAFVLAVAGLINSLMTLTVLDEMTDSRGSANRVCISQGLGNFFTGLFGGMGGCSMMGQSIINVNSGGKKNLSGIVAGLFLLSFIVFGSSIIESIPIAALVGVMFMVVIGTFKWSSLRMFGKMPKIDIALMIIVTIIMIKYNLAYAVIAGIIISALKFAWEKGKNISANTYIDENGSKVYQLDGPLFFGSVASFKDIFTVNEDPSDIIIEFKNSRVFDHSAIEAINAITEKYGKDGKTLHLRYLSSDCTKLLKNAEKIIEVNIKEDPNYHIADDQLA